MRATTTGGFPEASFRAAENATDTTAPIELLEVVERWYEDRRYDLLQRAAKHVFTGALRHYRAERGTGSDRLELSPFYKGQQVYEQFERFWRSQKNPAKPKYTKAAGAFREGLRGD